MFSNQYLVGSLLITLCVVFHVMALMLLSRALAIAANWFDAHAVNWIMLKKLTLLTVAVLYAIMIHVIEIVLWAVAYMRMGEFDDFVQAVYFSTITATTLGYGDITLSEKHQLLSGFEAIGGLILFRLANKLNGLFIGDAQQRRAIIRRQPELDFRLLELIPAITGQNKSFVGGGRGGHGLNHNIETLNLGKRS